jgi:hypothetical protein
MMGRRRESFPYVMRGGPRKIPKRKTVLDDPDPRIAPLVPRRVTLAAVKKISNARGADTRLEDVDALARRWARGEGARGGPSGSRHPLETIQLLHDGAVLGGIGAGVPEDIRIFDDCFHHAGDHHQAIIRIWYGNHWAVETKAKRLGISRASLYREWGRTLSHFHGWLRAHGLEI